MYNIITERFSVNGLHKIRRKGAETVMGIFGGGMPKDKSPRANGGPLVKSGPTAGQVRSRNNDGTWRKKRSDAGVRRKP